MITAAISTFLIGLLAYFGVTLSVAQIAGLVIAVKIVVVGVIFGITWWVQRRKAPPEPPVT